MNWAGKYNEADKILYEVSELLLLELLDEINKVEKEFDNSLCNFEELDARIASISMRYKKEKNVPHIMKKIVMLVIAIFVAAAAAMSVKAIRDAVINFFVEIYEKYSVAYYVPDDEENDTMLSQPETIEYYYVPSYIPEGFEMFSEKKRERVYSIEYINGEYIFVYEQRCIGTTYAFDSEDAQGYFSDVNGISVYFIEKNGICTAYWSTQGYEFRIHGDIDANEIMKMTKSLKFSEKIVTN